MRPSTARTVEVPAISLRSRRRRRCVVALTFAALAACRAPSGDEPRARGQLEARLAASERRLAQLEEDDRYLFAEASTDLERGWPQTGCERFETLLRRFPQSPLAAEARTRMEKCAPGASATASVEPSGASGGDTSAGTPTVASVRGISAPAASGPIEASDAPLEITRSWVKEDRFGVPLANLRLTNRGDRTVVGYKVALRCYDEHDTVLKHLTKGTRWFVAAGGSRQAARGEVFAGGPWPLTAFLGTARVEAVVLSVDYADGTTWQRDDLSSFGIDKE